MTNWESLGFEGTVFTKIEKFDDEIHFHTSEGEKHVMKHFQDCCESVYVEDIVGDLEDLLNSPILLSEESGESGVNGDWGDTYTWTFYKFATIKGSVTIRWYGNSNGYYSESVTFYKHEEGKSYYW
ncbi:hypothetical protein NX029_26275 [Cytobacillus firmus]|nr:hypothetical protein [Cytobacillus firmus]